MGVDLPPSATAASLAERTSRQALFALAEDPRPVVEVFAIRALFASAPNPYEATAADVEAARRERKALVALCARRLHAPDGRVAVSALRCLKALSDDPSPLVEAMLRHPSADVQREAAFALLYGHADGALDRRHARELAWLLEQPVGEDDQACLGPIAIAAGCWLLASWPGADAPWVHAAARTARSTLRRAPVLAHECAKLDADPPRRRLMSFPSGREVEDDACYKLLSWAREHHRRP